MDLPEPTLPDPGIYGEPGYPVSWWEYLFFGALFAFMIGSIVIFLALGWGGTGCG